MRDLNLAGKYVEEQYIFVTNLHRVGIVLSNQDDFLVWNKNKRSGYVSVNLACKVIMDDGFDYTPR